MDEGQHAYVTIGKKTFDYCSCMIEIKIGSELYFPKWP